MVGVEDEGRAGAWQVVPRIAGGALSVPVVLGFVALGTAVVVGRSLRDGVRQVWTWSAGWRSPRREEPAPAAEAAPEPRHSHAA
jgi:hypothetical protein